MYRSGQSNTRRTGSRVRRLIVAALVMAWSPVMAHAADDSVTAAQLLPLREAEARFVVTAGKDKGRVINATLERDDEGWRLDMGKMKDRRLRAAKDGAVTMPWTEVEDSDSTLRFSPAAQVLPAKLTKGKAVKTDGRVRISNIAGDRNKASGKFERTVTLIGRQRVTTPAGAFDAHNVRAVEKFDLGLADVLVTTDTHYAPGTGIVRQHVVSKVTKLGLFTSTEKTTIALQKPWSDSLD